MFSEGQWGFRAEMGGWEVGGYAMPKARDPVFGVDIATQMG